MTPKQLGDKSRLLLDDPAFVAAIKGLKEDIYKEIAQSSHEEQSKREDCYYTLKAIDRFQTQLKRYVHKGQS